MSKKPMVAAMSLFTNEGISPMFYMETKAILLSESTTDLCLPDGDR
jgi:hypothetical protein